MKTHSLLPNNVKTVIDAKIKGLPVDEQQFMFYHLNRNKFNVKNEVTSLKSIGGSRFRDNLGFVWEEQSTLKNYFHMPFGNYVGSNLGITKPYSRKFLRDDTVSGLEGEYEMIIRHDGKRVDGITSMEYQETYNFGRTRNFSQHKALDVNPHNENPNYILRQDMGWVNIQE